MVLASGFDGGDGSCDFSDATDGGAESRLRIRRSFGEAFTTFRITRTKQAIAPVSPRAITEITMVAVNGVIDKDTGRGVGGLAGEEGGSGKGGMWAIEVAVKVAGWR